MDTLVLLLLFLVRFFLCGFWFCFIFCCWFASVQTGLSRRQKRSDVTVSASGCPILCETVDCQKLCPVGFWELLSVHLAICKQEENRCWRCAVQVHVSAGDLKKKNSQQLALSLHGSYQCTTRSHWLMCEKCCRAREAIFKLGFLITPCSSMTVQ